ncbi:hypothetical protein LSAT2_006678 [Lamellibrachia satsuma]|nr:hypothetical protein LSAT2_006678 [Lamellibrachia satsuma]
MATLAKNASVRWRNIYSFVMQADKSLASIRSSRHVLRHDEVANKVLLWKPGGPRRRSRLTTAQHNNPEKDTNLSGTHLLTATKNRNNWLPH